MKESHWHSFLKAISWRAFGTLSTMLIVFILTHQLETSVYFGFLELIAKLFLFYIHERLWLRFR